MIDLRFVARVEQDEEGIVHDPATSRISGRDALSIEVDSEGLRIALTPIVVRHA